MARKKFDKLTEGNSYVDIDTLEEIGAPSSGDGESGDAVRVRGKKYSFRRAEKPEKDKKVYKVGFVGVYVAFAACFVLALINFVMEKEGFYAGLSEAWEYAARAISFVVIFALPAVSFALFSKKATKEAERLSFYRFSSLLLPLAASSVFVSVFAALDGRLALDFFMPLTSGKPDLVYTIGQNHIAVIICYALVPAICEEILFRGVLQPELTKAAGGLAGIIVTSLAASLTGLDLKYFAVAFAVSLVLSVLRHVGGSVVPCIAVSFIYKLFFVYFSGRISFISSEHVGNTFILIILTIILLICAIFYLKVLESICTRKAMTVDAYIAGKENGEGSEEPDKKDAKAKGQGDSEEKPEKTFFFYSMPSRLFSDSGYTLHKFLRVLLSPVIIIAVIIFFIAVLL